MTPKLRALCDSLEAKITDSYEGELTMAIAEKLSAEFLVAQMQLAKAIRVADLDSRLRKSGVKAIKAAAYNEIGSKSDKRMTVDAMDHALNMDSTVNTAQDEFDKAETDRDELERYYDIFRECHVYYRGIAKGIFHG
jgi:tartrate dehydratase beta subunit/fumarate hydratase class I family protein